MSTQHPLAAELPPHGYIISKPVPGSDIPADYTFVLTRDEIYVPIAVRKPKGSGPWPAIIMGRGNGRGGLPLVEEKFGELQVRAPGRSINTLNPTAKT